MTHSTHFHMRVFALFFLALAAVSAYEKDGDVLVLTDDTLSDAIKEYEYILVEFYAPWCGHCKSLEPEYAKAATELAALDTPIPLAKVDATENSKVAGEYGVRGYPTLKWFVNGKDTEYNGGRTHDTIVQWIKKKTGPPCKPLADQAAVDAFKKEGDVTVVAFMSQDSEEFKVVENVGRELMDTLFGVADSAEGEKAGSIVLYKDFDEGRMVFDGEVTAEAIKAFVVGNSVPLVSTFSQETAPKIFGNEDIDNHFLYFNSADSDSHEATMAALKEVATEFKGKTLFVFVPATEERVMSYFDFTADELPKAVLVRLGSGDMKKFAFDKDITSENIRAHLTAYHAGELTPTLKSEDIPEDNSGPVTVIVGKNFNDVVLDETKDVLLEFYAPWCGHCKSLAPTWDKLGEKFAHNPNIVIAKVDATANDIDHPEVNVRGFPTILYFPSNGKDKPQTYNGGRDLDDLVSFLEENATVEKVAAPAHSEL